MFIFPLSTLPNTHSCKHSYGKPLQECAPLGYTLVQTHATTGPQLLVLHPELSEPLLQLFFSLDSSVFYLFNFIVVHQLHKLHSDLIVMICCCRQCYSDVVILMSVFINARQKHDRSSVFVLKSWKLKRAKTWTKVFWDHKHDSMIVHVQMILTAVLFVP